MVSQGKLAIRWVVDPTTGRLEYQVAAEGLPEAQPSWAARELRRIADQLDAQGGWSFRRPLDPVAPASTRVVLQPDAGDVDQAVDLVVDVEAVELGRDRR